MDSLALKSSKDSHHYGAYIAVKPIKPLNDTLLLIVF